MEIKVLIADDELKYREILTDFLESEGYVVIAAKDGSEAVDLFFSITGINLVILDVMMPKLDGWEVCKVIKDQSDVPVVMLTALGDERNEVHGFNIGADEYISKPFNYEIFIARINALLRKEIKESNNIIQIKEIMINQSSRTVSIDSEAIDLSPKEYQLLLYLVKNIGRALSRDQILNSVWGFDFFGGTRTVDTHIRGLRSKLGEHGQLIHTVRSFGYGMKVNI